MGEIPKKNKTEKLLSRLEASRVVERLFGLLPSTYFTTTSSTTFGLHYRAISDEMARMYRSRELVQLDVSRADAAFEMLWRNFGMLLDYYTKVFESESYREFLTKLVELYFMASRVLNIEDGAEYFSERDAQVVEFYKFAIDPDPDRYQSALGMPQKVLGDSDVRYFSPFKLNSASGITFQDLRQHRVLTNRDIFIFSVGIIVDAEDTESPFRLLDDVRTFVRILKPAHTLAEVSVVFQEEEWVGLGDLRPNQAYGFAGDEMWCRWIDLVLNPPRSVYDDGRELLNSVGDGYWEASSLMKDHSVYFDYDDILWSESWSPLTETPPQVTCLNDCQLVCEAACEGADCQAFCESAIQVCYNCQVHCESICQTLAELRDPGLVPDGCVEVCETVDEWGACTTGCESICQTGCEVDCMIACESACQIGGQSCGIDGCQTDIQFPCFVLDQGACYTSDEHGVVCAVGCQIACQDACQTSCEVGCMVQCQFACEVGCEAACQDGCQTSCQMSCEINCEDACQRGCQGGCELSCLLSCQRACMVACLEACELGCQDTCLHTCQSEKQIACLVSCEGGCQGEMQYCRSGCEGGCQTGCVVECQAECQMHCQTGCQVTVEVCHAGCEAVQQAECRAACEQACLTGCEQGCQEGCELSCEVAGQQACGSIFVEQAFGPPPPNPFVVPAEGGSTDDDENAGTDGRDAP